MKSKSKKYLYGAHLTLSESIYDKIKRIKNMGGNLLQVFLRDPHKNNSKIKLSSQKDIIKIYNFMKKNNIYIVVHLSYLINLSKNPKDFNSSPNIKQIINEFKIMAKLHPYCLGGVIHCGKKKNIKEKQAEKNMIINLNNILKKINAVNKPPIPSDIKMFLETSSGMGSEICSKIGRLKSVYQTINNNRLKICVDTAHIFAAGYSMENYFKEFSKKIGLQEIGLIHLNDSKEPRGSNLDKHESIGYGFIFNKKLKGSMKSFKYVLKYIKKLVIPTVLETHSDCIYKKDYYHSLLVGNKDISYQKEIILILKELKLNKELKYIKNNPHKTGISVMSKKAQQKNEQIINMLKNVSDIEKAKGNRFKNIAYNKAIAILKSYPTEIKSGEELIKLDGIGKSIAAKITEFLNTGSLKYLVKKENKVSYEAIRDISSVEGIGPSLAKKLVEKEKIESIKDLQNAVKNGKIKLTHAQQIGLKYFSDLQKEYLDKKLLNMINYLKHL